jgi:PIN domain nuclease of toxin-antitoxin system
VTHLVAVSTLPLHHRDPFDRLLIAQAMVEQIPITTSLDPPGAEVGDLIGRDKP